MYVKWTGDLPRKRCGGVEGGTKVTGHSMRISSGVTARTLQGIFFLFFFSCWKIPAGLKGSYLLLLPITGQSLALSTCKMTLGMPVLMVFYRLRLCVSEMRPSGALAVHARPPARSLPVIS